MSQNSTSFHKLNGDDGLSFFQKALYYGFNALNNAQPYRGVDSHLSIRRFQCRHLDERYPLLARETSPSRKLGDLFWMSLPWQDIQVTLGDLHVLDTGCGKGQYGEFLAKTVKAPIESYVGLDAFENANWAALQDRYSNFKFQKMTGEALLPHIPSDTNFFMSQSAIEHFSSDIKYFSNIKEFIQTHSRPCMQVHLFPSSECLKLYGCHGYRQYVPRTISKITRLFPEDQCTLFELGGRHSNQLHYQFITLPNRREGRDDRNEKADSYAEACRKAIEADQVDSGGEVSFYALVILSNVQGELLAGL